MVLMGYSPAAHAGRCRRAARDGNAELSYRFKLFVGAMVIEACGECSI